MKKVILSLVLLLCAVCVSGQVYNLNGDDVTDDYVKGKTGTYIVNGRKCVVSDGRTIEEIKKEQEERFKADMEKKEAARRLCESVPLDKYRQKVCKNIYVRINTKKVSKEEYQDFIMFLKGKGIDCRIQMGTITQLKGAELDYAVTLYTHNIEDYKIGIRELNYADFIKCFNGLYHQVEEYTSEKTTSYENNTISGRGLGSAVARGNYYGAMYRLTGNIGFLTKGILL